MIELNSRRSTLLIMEEEVDSLALDIEAVILLKSAFMGIEEASAIIPSECEIARLKESLKNKFLSFCHEKNNVPSLCRRVEKIWQSQQSQLLLPDTQLTLGRSFLEGPINSCAWRAIREEIEVFLIRRMIDCLEGFEESFNQSYISLCSSCYVNLDKIPWIEEFFLSAEMSDQKEFQALKKGLLNYVEEGVLSNKIDFSLFCNPDLRCLFFEIINDQNKVVGHLLGSVHTLPENAAKLPRHIQEAFQAANVFAVEIDMYNGMEIQLIENAINSKKINSFYCRGSSFKFLDEEYLLAAKKMNKLIISLETKEVIDEVKSYYERTKKTIKDLMRFYVKVMHFGDLEQFKNYCRENVFKDMSKEDKHLVIHSRDKVQASGIDAYLRHHSKKRLFTMIGAAHLPGVINLLRKKGWQLNQV